MINFASSWLWSRQKYLSSFVSRSRQEVLLLRTFHHKRSCSFEPNKIGTFTRCTGLLQSPKQEKTAKTRNRLVLYTKVMLICSSDCHLDLPVHIRSHKTNYHTMRVSWCRWHIFLRSPTPLLSLLSLLPLHSLDLGCWRKGATWHLLWRTLPPVPIAQPALTFPSLSWPSNFLLHNCKHQLQTTRSWFLQKKQRARVRPSPSSWP